MCRPPRTRYDYGAIFHSRLAETFGHRPLSSIDRIMVGGWIDAMIAEGLSPARIRKVHTVLSAALDAAVDAGLIGRNVARRAELPRIERRRKRFLSGAEVARHADAMPDRSSRVLVLVAAYGGLRWGELAALRRDRCDLLRRRIIVDTAISDVAGRLEAKAPKSHAARLVALPAFVADELARHLVDVAPEADAWCSLRRKAVRCATRTSVAGSGTARRWQRASRD